VAKPHLFQCAPKAAAGSTQAAARLLIHAEDQLSDMEGLQSAWHRLRARFSRRRQPATQTRLQLRVDDLQGRQLRAVDDAGPLTDWPLPAGTYRITAICGDLRRRYTLTLEPGASFDLYLRFTPELQ